MTARVTLVVSGLASPPVNTVAPAVTGTAVVGQQLSCTTGTWTGSPAPTFTYQWKRNGATIGGATASTYTLVQADAGNTANIKCTVTATNSAGAVSADSNTVVQVLDAEAADYFTRASITDSTAKNALNTFIIGVKSDFTISALSDVFDQLVMQANESAAAAVVDMTSNALNQTLVNSPTFTQWRGVTGSRVGADRYVNMGFNPTTNAVRYTQNSHSFGFYNRTHTTAQLVMGEVNGSVIGRAIWLNLGTDTYYYSSNAQMIAANGGNNSGFQIVSRTASNAAAGYKNGSSVVTSSSTPIAEANLVFLLVGANVNGTLLGADVATEASFSFIARGMTAGEVSAFNTRVQTLKTAIGW